MKISDKCTVCHERIRDVVTCEDCGREVHERCVEYETTFECRYCADEKEIGAVEL